jgi:hypothetical protein
LIEIPNILEGNKIKYRCDGVALIFNHKGNFKLGNLFHSLLRGNNLNVEVRTSFRNLFYYQSLKGHEADAAPSARLFMHADRSLLLTTTDNVFDHCRGCCLVTTACRCAFA